MGVMAKIDFSIIAKNRIGHKIAHKLSPALGLKYDAHLDDCIRCADEDAYTFLLRPLAVIGVRVPARLLVDEKELDESLERMKEYLIGKGELPQIGEKLILVLD